MGSSQAAIRDNALSQVKFQGQEKPFIGKQSLWYKCDKPSLVKNLQSKAEEMNG
jgi:hypothetical protein